MSQIARATEAQAIGRSQRTGQTRQVTIVRLICKGETSSCLLQSLIIQTDTVEHDLYIRNTQNNKDPEVVDVNSNNNNNQLRTSSVGLRLSTPVRVSTMLSNNPEMTKEDLKKSIEMFKKEKSEGDGMGDEFTNKYLNL